MYRMSAKVELCQTNDRERSNIRRRSTDPPKHLQENCARTFTHFFTFMKHATHGTHAHAHTQVEFQHHRVWDTF